MQISIKAADVTIQANIYPHGPERGEIFSPEKNKVGWWTGSGYVAPGESGPALLAGHVTDVFAELVPQDDDKQPLPITFDEVEITDETGRIFVFTVQDQFREYKEQIAWEEIYQVHPSRVLWLFTCGGTDEDGDGHREWNDIVRTTLDRVIEPDGTVIDIPEEGS
jgi:hypothetical protein